MTPSKIAIESGIGVRTCARILTEVTGKHFDRKRAEGKRHNQALIALARRRSDVLFAMLRDGTLYQEPEPRNLPSAA